MNIEKEIEKHNKRKQRIKKQQNWFESLESKIMQFKKRIKPVKERWYSFNREKRYNRLVGRIVNQLLDSIKNDYVRSLKFNSTPTLHYPLTINHSFVFTNEYMDVYRFGKSGAEGFNYKEGKKVYKHIKKIIKLGYQIDEGFLQSIHEVIREKHNESFQITSIQYERPVQGTLPTPNPYLILSINGPHPRKYI